MGYLAMKRNRDDEGELESLAMASYLMLLSRNGSATMFEPRTDSDSPSRVFECKTCNRQFPSFQALGGHRASHKKPRLMGTDGQNQTLVQDPPAKPKTHECSICGLEFAIGQALGGHMRRHRAAMTDQNQTTNLSLHLPPPPPPPPPQQVPTVKKSNSRRVLCLDLNLTPLENDLKFDRFKKVTSMIDCFL